MGLGTPAGKLTGKPIVFAGYGITNKGPISPAYDDYADIDAAGKVVVILRDVPRTTNKTLMPDNRTGFRQFTWLPHTQAGQRG